MLGRQLLPIFGSKPLDRISRARIEHWFDAFSGTAPANANRALELLRQIMNFAIACGHIDTNPAQGMKCNRRPALTRFLSVEEIGRLHRVLDRQTRRNSRQQADIIRLLLLTGCRKTEIVRLRWSEVQGDTIVLADSKTGPRKVPLNTQARRVLERLPQNGSAFVFPSPLVVKHALLTPHNPARSMGYRADRHRTRAPINTTGSTRWWEHISWKRRL